MKKSLLSLFVFAIVLVGCGQATTKNTSPSNNVNESYHATSADQASQDEAIKHLEGLAKGIDGVENAHVVIIGKTAVVGIDVDSKLERSRVGTIKYSVAEAFHEDPYGVNAVVTADVDLNERIKEMGQDIRAGRPILGITEELADIIGRIIPQVPADIMPSRKENQLESKQYNKKATTPEELVEQHEQQLKSK